MNGLNGFSQKSFNIHKLWNCPLPPRQPNLAKKLFKKMKTDTSMWMVELINSARQVMVCGLPTNAWISWQIHLTGSNKHAPLIFSAVCTFSSVHLFIRGIHWQYIHCYLINKLAVKLALGKDRGTNPNKRNAK